MKEVRIEDWLLKIELEKMTAVYETHTDFCDCLSCQNFRKAHLYLDDEVMHFSNVLGIDLHKPSLLNAFEVEGKQIMYSGHYHVCGEILEGELDEWDVVIGPHCFSLVEEGSSKPKMVTAPYFQIGFEVVLPWLLPEAMELMKK